MMRRIALLCLLLCTACGFGQTGTPPRSTAAAVPVTNACRIGPNDGPVLAERGIGGTGMLPFKTTVPVGETPLASPAGQNRGIGGTGTAPAGAATKAVAADTGIVGEITGFASVCLNGVEVAYDPATAINIEGQVESPAALRAGQIAAITAGTESGTQEAGTKDGLLAVKVAIRYEVTGPVSAVTANTLTVAGQTVTRNAGTRGLQTIAPGDWIAVSGFRTTKGVIAATRIDPQTAGIVIVHGKLIKKGHDVHISALQLNVPPNAPALRNGEAVTVTGALNGTVLDARSITPDLLYSNPQAYFGPSVKRILMQSYVYTLGSAVHVALGGSLGILEGVRLYNRPGLALLELVELPGTSVLVVGQLFGIIDGEYNPFTHKPANIEGNPALPR